MKPKLQIKVSPSQMKFYEEHYPGSKVEMIKRMVREFNLGMSMANTIYDNFPESFLLIESSSNFDKPFLPSHSSDNRSSIFLQKETLDNIDKLMHDHLGGDPYELYMEVTDDIRKKVFESLSKTNKEESGEKLFLAVSQYPIGVYSLEKSGLDSVEEVKDFLHKKIKEGADLSEVSADFLRSTSCWEMEQKVVAYIAVAELLYGVASIEFKRLKEENNR